MRELFAIEINTISGGKEGAAGRLGDSIGHAFGTAWREIREHYSDSGLEVIGMLIAGNHEDHHDK